MRDNPQPPAEACDDPGSPLRRGAVKFFLGVLGALVAIILWHQFVAEQWQLLL